MRRILRYIALALYYLFAMHLPRTTSRLSFGSGAVRRTLCRLIFRSMGRHVNIEKGAYFGTGEQLSIGDYSGIGVNCECVGPITIGRYVMMGPHTIIITQCHDTAGVTRPMAGRPPGPVRAVVIEDDVWIGTRVIILPGVKIHRGAIIGAGAVVSRDVPPYSVVGGSPARVLKYRTDDPALIGEEAAKAVAAGQIRADRS